MLRICLFGNFRLTHSGSSISGLVTKTVQVLLAYLLLHRERIHSREVLTGLLWGDHDEGKARNCLSTALWRLRRALEPGSIPKGTYLIATPRGEVGFNGNSDYWLDVAVFEDLVAPIVSLPLERMRQKEALELEKGLKLYTGELLENVYADWALHERERLRTLHIKGLMHLMRFQRELGNYEASLDCGSRILEHDPLYEEIHREMMRCFAAQGQRSLAIRQYRECCAVLERELGVAPMPETQQLHADILQQPGAAYPGPRREVSQHPAPELEHRAPSEVSEAALSQIEIYQALLRSFHEFEQQFLTLRRTAQEIERSIRRLQGNKPG